MRLDPAINMALNAVLKVELTAINQFFLHARMLQNWGLNALGGHTYGVSISCMKQSDLLIKRILFLEGLPNLQDLGRLQVAEKPEETVSCDLGMCTQMRTALVDAIALCEEKQDYQSREHLDGLLHEVEEEIDFYETQEHLISSLGLENYLQSQMDEED